MHSHVDFEAASPSVALVANDADEGPLTRVGEHMGLQVTLGNELILAVAAAEGTLSRVRAHVSLQISSLAELLQTAVVRAEQNFGFVLDSRYLFN